jgi:pimeloyl-ACP methyl ester carboxylesterase
MALPALVLVHGGGLAGDCWEPKIHRLAPEITVLVVDLPGRRGEAVEPASSIFAHFAESVVGDVEDAGLGDIVIVGHSLAGLTVPRVVAKLGSSRVREMILAAAYVPPEGKSIVDTLTGPFAPVARRNAKRDQRTETPRLLARFAFFNGMSRVQRKFMSDKLCSEPRGILTENASRQGMPDDVPRTWILTLRDRALSVKAQQSQFEAIGGVQALIPIDTCHILMVSEPERLVERCRVYAK